ncbi:prolyl oligopeptidase family serine peptidase [Spirosoma arcticum]
MQDPKVWIGTSPTSPFWSDDSRTLYFNWNPDKATSDSLYKVTFTTGRSKTLIASSPTKVSPIERRGLPTAPLGAYNRTYTQRLFERQGDLFLLDVKSGSTRQLTNTVEAETDVVFSGDGQRAVFRRNVTNLFSIDLSTGQLTQLTDFRTGESPPTPKTTDEEKFLKQDQLRLSTVLSERKAKKDEGERTSKADRPPHPKAVYLNGRQLTTQQVSPDGTFVTYRLTKSAANAKLAQVPSYVTESGYTEEIPARTKVGAPQATHEFFVYNVGRDTVWSVNVRSIPGIYDQPDYLKTTGTTKPDTAKKARPVIINGPVWSADGKLCVVVVRSVDYKDRWIMRLDPSAGPARTPRLTLLDRQHDDAWVAGPGIGSTLSTGNMSFLADNQTLWFQSEADGYSHIYTVDVLTNEKKQLTAGKFEVQQVQLSKDKTHFFLQTNEVHPGEQHYYRMPITGGERTRLTTMTGANDVTLSPDETRMAIRYSSSNQPWELYVADVSQPSLVASKTRSVRSVRTQTEDKAIKLTSSQTDAFKAYLWRDPTLVTIPARDGQTIYARLYRPDTPTGKSVVFVHGAGYLQNAHKWWSQYFREYMFHNLLVDKGYTVLDIDYRASAGYGRDWRTGIYRYMGGKDLDDHIDAAKWLVQTQGVDAKRIGIYGGSYGGFITLMAMFTQPDVFKAGAALRPVTDWAAYNHPYTVSILNEPQSDSVAYRRSSPINFAEGLKGHLLICHGMVDVNVHVQDAIRLSQRLIELKKENWELALYPVEDHGFVEPTSWMDEYKRILKLFEERL